MITPKDQKWMALCIFASGVFSTCSKAQYFAIVLDAHGRTIGTGYNGGPPGAAHCTDGGCPRSLAAQQGDPVDANYQDCIAIHAEENALLYSDASARRGGTLYVNGICCFNCAKKVAGSGVSRLVMLKEERPFSDWADVLLTQAGITVDYV